MPDLDPASLFEQNIIIAGEALPDNERPLYQAGAGIQTQGASPCIKKTVTVVGAVAVVALIVAVYAVMKK